MGCPGIRPSNWQISLHTSLDGRQQQPNLIYQDTIRGMRLDPTQIRHSNTTFKGVMPVPGARCTGSLLLQVTFGSLDNFRREHLTFHITPFQSGYHALLGREAFARFNAIPHYAFLTLKCPVHEASSP